MEYKTGQIIFFNGDQFYGKIIQLYNLIKFKQEGYTHVGIITKVTKDDILIHEAVANGFISSYYSKSWINKQDKQIVDIKQTKIRLSGVHKNAEKYAGRPYAWFDIFGIALSFLFGFRFLKVTGANKLICSEAVARILYDSSNKKINFESEYNKSYDMITPMDIYLSKYLNG